ncbi:MAG: xylulokinase [Nitrospinota bacterium]|nr:MAG: xylulokinase [Nitrospinota bacterium]
MGLDIGTTGARGLLVSPTGEVLARAAVPYPLLTPRPGWSEQDPEDWWDASCQVLRALAAAARQSSRRMVALGLTGQMHGAVFLDAQGEVIRPALLWNDQRTAAECQEIEERVGADRLRAIAGNPALTGFQAPKILWLRRHEPEAYRRVRYILLPKDFLRYRLSGVLATDASDAAGTLLLALRERDWSAEILQALDLPLSWFPRVYEGPEVTGEVSREGSLASGLPAGLPIMAGGGDNAAAAVGSGVVREGSALVSLGTSGVVFAHSDTLKIDPSGALHAFCHAVPGKYHLMGVVLSAGGSLRWYRDTLGSEEEAVAGRTGQDPYHLLLEEAARVSPGAEGLYFLPYLAGERTPHMDPQARGAWIGLSLAHRREHLVRALLEGVGFALKDSLVRIQGLGVNPRVLQAVGGGVQSPVWRKILAAILGLPLQRLAVEEGPAFGAALLAGVGVGLYPDVETAVTRAVHPLGEVEKPDLALKEVYERLYARYTRLYPALQRSGVWQE